MTSNHATDTMRILGDLGFEKDYMGAGKNVRMSKYYDEYTVIVTYHGDTDVKAILWLNDIHVHGDSTMPIKKTVSYNEFNTEFIPWIKMFDDVRKLDNKNS